MTLLFVTSENRSGSTLLDMLLSNHTDVTSVGELSRLHRFYRKGKVCTCGSSVPECPFWSRIQHQLQQQGRSLEVHPLRRKIVPRWRGVMPSLTELLLLFGSRSLVKAAARFSRTVGQDWVAAENTWRIVDLVADQAESKVVIDSSKKGAKWKLLSLQRPRDLKLVYLVRDGRGTVYSKLARGRERISFPRTALSWTLNNTLLLILQLTMPRDRRLTVKYEELCDSTEDVLKRICEFAGVKYQPGMEALHQEVKHNIGGSPHRFDHATTIIQQDLRWRVSLTKGQLRIFRVIAGPLNRYLGYR